MSQEKFNQSIKQALDDPRIQADNEVMIYRERDQYSWYPAGPSSRPWVNLVRFGMTKGPPVPNTWMLEEQTPEAHIDTLACDDDRVVSIAAYGGMSHNRIEDGTFKSTHLDADHNPKAVIKSSEVTVTDLDS